MCVWCDGTPALVRKLLQLRTFILKLSVQIIIKWVAIYINNEDNPFPCASPLLDLLQEVCVEEQGRIRLEPAKLDVPQVLLIYCLESI